MKESILYSKAINGNVICNTCSHYCNIPEGSVGKCGLRINIDGKLNVLNSGKIIHIAVDPIEKKPLFHFFPGSKILSISGLGCNFRCPYCINWDTAQFPSIYVKEHNREETNALIEDSGYDLKPDEVIEQCKSLGLESIAYTYNEPTIMLDTYLPIMKLARKNNIKNVWVSNGYFSLQSFNLFSPYLDAINIDLKSYSEKFYKRHCEGNLEVVKNNIRLCYENNIWVEVTTLLIPGENDTELEIKKIASFVNNISSNIPLHFTAFTPEYRMLDKSITPSKKLRKAQEIAQEIGLKFIYTGNDSEPSNTYCPDCHSTIIERKNLVGKVIYENTLLDSRKEYSYEKSGIDKSVILRGKKAKNIGKKILRDSQKATTDTQNHLLCKKCGFDIAGRF